MSPLMKFIVLFISVLAFIVIHFYIAAGAQSATSKEIHEWVDGHNNRRLRVAKGQVGRQPSASEMNAIVMHSS